MMGFQLPKPIPLGLGQKGARGAQLPQSGQLRTEQRSEDHRVFPGIFHYKATLGGDPGRRKLVEAFG